jgi:DNA-binding NtrC family response regulator
MSQPQAPHQKRAYDRTSHIMIVDDDQTLLKFFKIHLNKFFSRVIVVKNAKEALDTLKEKEIDLVLSDIRMPKVDGLQLLKKIRNENASIPVFLISGALLTNEQLKLIEETADGFLKKPFTVEEIQEFIDLGMKKRELLKQLSEIITDNEQLLAVLKGKSKAEKAINNNEQLGKANEILTLLAG